MESRHKLPAPPLVLQPVFRRVPQGSSRALRLLDLARFLSGRGLLTDGGNLNLNQGLKGRNHAVSLTTQDVRGRAHGLTLELLEAADPAGWSEIADSYFRRFDRGKPRRPTRLQRLYLEWSRDCSWPGMLEACRTHPHLWENLRAAFPYQGRDDPDRLLLELALEVHDSGCWEGWRAAYEDAVLSPRALLTLLPLLPSGLGRERLAWLAERALEVLTQTPMPTWSEELMLACRRCPAAPVVVMPPSLRALLSRLVEHNFAEVDPRWLAVARGYRWPERELRTLWARLSDQDPVHRILYGPRPGQSWLEELRGQLWACSIES